MAKIIEKVALCIGLQVAGRGTVLAAISGATGMIEGAATGTNGTGIFLRSSDDLSLAFERVENDGGTSGGLTEHGSRLSGGRLRTDSALVFTIDVKGNGVATDGPASPDYDQAEYLERILSMGGFALGTSGSSDTTYEFSGTQLWHSIKVWRNGESWTLVGCRADLAYSFTAGDKATLTVTVHNDTVIHDADDTFPTTIPATAYGNQVDPAPILQQANCALDGVTRGFQSASLSIAYAAQDFADCNLADGIQTDAGIRTVDFSGDYIVDGGADSTDFANLESDMDTGTSPVTAMIFTCGQAAGDADLQEATKFDIPNLRITSHAKVSSTSVVRTLAGYAVIAGSAGDGSAAQEELVISGV